MGAELEIFVGRQTDIYVDSGLVTLDRRATSTQCHEYICIISELVHFTQKVAYLCYSIPPSDSILQWFCRIGVNSLL